MARVGNRRSQIETYKKTIDSLEKVMVEQAERRYFAAAEETLRKIELITEEIIKLQREDIEVSKRSAELRASREKERMVKESGRA